MSFKRIRIIYLVTLHSLFMTLDPTTLVEIGAVLAVGKAKSDTLIGRFLGPSFYYARQALQNGIAKSYENVSRVFAYSLRIFGLSTKIQ